MDLWCFVFHLHKQCDSLFKLINKAEHLCIGSVKCLLAFDLTQYISISIILSGWRRVRGFNVTHLWCSCSELLRVLWEEAGPGAVAVPPHRRQEVAVLQGGAPRLQVLRAPHAPWPQPFKKACGIQDRLACASVAAAPVVHRDNDDPRDSAP